MMQPHPHRHPSATTEGWQPEPITARERDVLALLARGYTNPEIAHALVISVSTVKVHLRHLYAKLGSHNRIEAINQGYRLGLIEPRVPT